MPTPKQQRRRALELLEASIDGYTEAIMLAYGFKTELLVELVNAELATSTIERMVISGRARRRAGQTGIADDYLLHCDMLAEIHPDRSWSEASTRGWMIGFDGRDPTR